MNLNFNITEKQKQFIQRDEFEVLFGGAAGGGKSYGQLIDAFLFALKYPKSKQLILRRTFPELEKSLVREHLKLYPKEIYTYHSSNHSGNFKNGSILDFGYCDNETDVFKYQSSEYDVIRFDEATHFTEYMYLYLISRCRGANKFPKQIKSSTNPGGVGHEFFKKRFIDANPWGESFEGVGGKRIFIPSKVEDNKFLLKNDPDYVKRLENLSQKDKQALLYGDWDIFEGKFFPEFKRDIHVVSPFIIPPDWRRYVTLDYGMDMLAAIWIAVDERGNSYCYKELYEGRDNGMGKDGRGHIVSDAAKRIKEVNDGEKIYLFLAPPDLFNRNRDTGRSTAQIFSEMGISLVKTSNNRISGWRSVREALKTEIDEQGIKKPDLVMFPQCKNLIRCMGSLQYDGKNFEDAANSPHEVTHMPDALRGYCAFNKGNIQRSKAQKDFIKENFTFRNEKDILGKGDEILVF